MRNMMTFCMGPTAESESFIPCPLELSGCISGGLDWILGKISLLEEWSGIGPGCPGRWWSPHPWGGSKNV